MRKTQAEMEGWPEFRRVVYLHAAHYAGFAASDGPLLYGAGKRDGGQAQRLALNSWSVEFENILGALDVAASSATLSLLIPIASHLQRYEEMTSRFVEQRQHFTRLVAAAQRQGSPQLELWAQMGLGQAQWRLGNYVAARQAVEVGCKLGAKLGDREGEAICQLHLGNVEHSQGNASAARTLFSAALINFRAIQSRSGEADCLLHLGMVERSVGNISLAQRMLDEGLAGFMALGERRGEARCMLNLGLIHSDQGNPGEATKKYEQALAIFQELGACLGEAHCLLNLGSAEYDEGNLDGAQDLLERALTRFRELGERLGEIRCLIGLVKIERRRHNPLGAIRLIAPALAVALELGSLTHMATCCTISGILLLGQAELRSAAMAFSAARACIAKGDFIMGQEATRALEEGQAKLQAAVDADQLSAADMALWRQQSESLPPEGLGLLTLNALEALLAAQAEQAAAQEALVQA